MSNFDAIASYLAGTLRFTRAGAAGALGNMQVESGFSPTAYNAAEGAIGLCQWELGRRSALQAYAARHGGRETDLAMQLGYLATELQSAEFATSVLSVMRTTANPTGAAICWDSMFERSAGTTRQERIANANRIYAELAAHPPTPPAPAPIEEEPPMVIVRSSAGGRAWLLVGPPRSLVLKSNTTVKNLRAIGVKVISADPLDYERLRKGAI